LGLVQAETLLQKFKLEFYSPTGIVMTGVAPSTAAPTPAPTEVVRKSRRPSVCGFSSACAG